MSSHMGVHNLFNFTAFFNVGINFLIATFLVKSVLSVDSRYETCKPINCGTGPNISYPFYLYNAGTDYCGYPGLVIGCEEYKPTYLTSLGRYTIKDISYENLSLWLVNEELISSTNCYAPLDGFTLDRSSLQFSPYHADLLFFYNCTDSFSFNYTTSSISCDSRPMKNASVALVPGNYEGWNWTANGSCEISVLAPVELEEGRLDLTINDVDYPKLLSDGFTLKWIGLYDCVRCQKSGGRCGFENGTSLCFCPDGSSHLKDCNDGRAENLGVKVAIVASAAGIAIIVVLFCCFRRIFPSNISMIFRKKNSRKNADVEAFIRNCGFLTPKRYSYSSIKKITNSFQEKLGQGGYGSVYKGKLQDERVVAVKVLNNLKSNGEEFINEVASISRTSHVNIVALSGFCFEGSKRALIYEFMPNGSLEKFIYDKKSSISDRQLGWKSLYQISLGIARGLEYLHRGCKTRIVHFDIKPHNILLDEDFCPKISDFGLSKLCPRKDSIISMTGARGTPGYIAPEVFCRNFGEVSHKSDVYSYGMMVLEMVGGRKNIDVGVDRTSEIYFPHLIYRRLELHDELGLQGIANEEDKEFARKMIIVSLWCIQSDPSSRPPISEVVDMLEGSLESLSIPPKPYLSSPSRSPPDSSTTNGIITL